MNTNKLTPKHHDLFSFNSSKNTRTLLTWKESDFFPSRMFRGLTLSCTDSHYQKVTKTLIEWKHPSRHKVWIFVLKFKLCFSLKAKNKKNKCHRHNFLYLFGKASHLLTSRQSFKSKFTDKIGLVQGFFSNHSLLVVWIR